MFYLFSKFCELFVAGMDCRRFIRFTTILFISNYVGLTLAFPRPDSVRKSDKAVVFPQWNSSQHHSLPVFPDPVADSMGNQRSLAPPVDKYGHPLCASNSEATFCEDMNDYPDSEIRRAVPYSTEEFKELFGTLSIHPRKITPGDISEETVCSQQSRMFYPKAAVNENDQWAYVVNDVDYVQAVMSEICDKEDKPCNYLDGALPAGVSSRCKQKFAYKRLLAVHPNNKKAYTDAFRFPSCCVCFVKRPFVMSSARMAKSPDNKP